MHGQLLTTKNYPAHNVCSAKEEKPWATVKETIIFRDKQFGVTTNDIKVIKYSSPHLSTGDASQDPQWIPETAGSRNHIYSHTMFFPVRTYIFGKV